MKLSTGKIAFPIEFDNGDKENIYFNPNDPDLSLRLNDMQDKIQERMSAMPEIEMSADGNPVDGKFIEQFREIRTIICEEIDRAFNGDISSIVFKHCSPFAIVGGEYFVLQFINKIIPEIEKEMKKATTQANKNMSKYIDKYPKKTK